jgi:MoaA/NifB/PqqE/SkfB family radical SAM enzyme
MSILDRLRRRHRRPLRALQVEVTSRCAPRCAICPRSSLAETWRDGDLKDALWKVVAANLELTDHVQLQGWGEPLLHPLLPVWARDARTAGCTVGLTTNGDLLEDAASWLLEGDVDRIVVSVAGNADNHAALRDGSQLELVLAAAGNLARRARELRLPLRILISYLLTRNNAADLPAVVGLAARAGVDELFVTHLDCPTSPDLVEQAAFSGDVLIEGVTAHLKEAGTVASDSGIAFRDQTQGGEEQLVCSLDPLRIVFVGWDGRVGPCVNLLLPVEGPIPRWSANGCTEVEAVSYGRLDTTGLADLLSSSIRKRFVAPWTRRLEAERRFLASVPELSVTGLRELDRADAIRTAALSASPFPDACTHCPKAHGW